ncbi:MAG: hypothetical protein M1480_15570 [Bacteroidetes bacterium]|nr:hypothetical protein [Bacteroidota bacterium]
MKLFLIFFFSIINLFSQSLDSVKTKNHLSITDTTKHFVNDTLTVVDSLKEKKIIKPDTLKPIYQKPFYDYSSFINRKTIDFLDYRYIGDFFEPMGLSYTRDYGFIGQPNEIMLYGVGYDGISYLEDGVLRNNRLQNLLDLNNLQSESIDSIEIIPSPRGFLYGTLNNPVSINFLTRDFISLQPYSRIKYYQGPSGEAMIDVIFNEKVYNKFNIFFDVTNRKYDTTASYTNSSFSTWQAKTQLKYFLSDKINITGTYDFVHSTVGLNGGVNIDMIPTLSPDTLYNGFLAPVNFPLRNQSYKNHFFNLRLLSNYFENSFTDLNFYYNFDYTELNQSQDSSYFKSVDKNKVYGISLRQDYHKDIFDFQLNGNYESGDLKYYSITNDNLSFFPVNYSNLSASFIASANIIDSSLTPSVFYKLLHGAGNNNIPSANGTNSGFGADLTYKNSDRVKFYIGFSFYKSGEQINYTQNYEAGFTSTFENVFADIKVFKRNNYFLPQINLPQQYPLFYSDKYNSDLLGVGANLNFSFWKIYFETQTSYYTSNNSSELLFLFPKVKFTGGIYYKDILFNENLDLKTGLVFKYTGKRSSSFGDLNAASTLDFTVAGEIQKVAMVYFTWENLLDNTYFIIPYYPMPRRGIRFGIAWELFN